jgi:hypothetical protein
MPGSYFVVETARRKRRKRWSQCGSSSRVANPTRRQPSMPSRLHQATQTGITPLPPPMWPTLVAVLGTASDVRVSVPTSHLPVVVMVNPIGHDIVRHRLDRPVAVVCTSRTGFRDARRITQESYSVSSVKANRPPHKKTYMIRTLYTDTFSE